MAALFLTAAQSAPDSIRIEAENYAAADTITGRNLRVISDSHASENLTVSGFDNPGTWLDYDLALAEPFRFRMSVRSAGTVGLVRRFEILFFPKSGVPEPAAVDTVITPPGSGAG